MHVAFLLPDLKGGGAQKMVINLANWVACNGHKTDLVLFNDTGLYKSLISEQVNVVNFERSRSVYALPDVLNYLKTVSPDVLFTALFHVNVIALLSRLCGRGIVRTKIVVSERNHITRYLASCSLFKRILWHWLIRVIYPLSDHIVGISNGVCDDVKSLLPSRAHVKIQTIYNPVVTNDLEEQIDQVVPDVFPEGCSIRLITSGRLVPQKDYPTLLSSFALYLKNDPKAYLVILGDGYLKAELQNLSEKLQIEKSVSFHGFVDTPLAYMKQADVFVITSAWEGFCNVIVEALYCGLKVVATDCPSGPAEILDGGKFGELCDVADIKSIASSVDKMASTSCGQHYQIARAQDFHVNVIGTQFIQLFEKVLDDKE